MLANVLVSQAARAARRAGEALPRVGPSFRDATRVAGANSAIWTDIYLANREAIAAEIDETVRAARGGRGGAAGGRPDGDRRVERGRARRPAAAARGGPGGRRRCTSCASPCPNRPGIVAQVALALGRAGVNIVDMALAPAADMRSGAMTLWIAGDEAAARAQGWSTGSASPGPSVNRRFEPAGPLRGGSRRPPTSRSRTAPRCSAR